MVHTSSHRRQNRGFTLLELMVALTAGTLVISSVYVIGAGTARNFQGENRISQSQMGLRTAIDQIRRDIARAGLMGSPNSFAENNCLPPPRHVQAIEFVNDTDNASIPNADANMVSADRVRLIGNYATSDSYLVNTVSPTGTSIRLQQNWQGFQRSFINRISNTYDTTLFEQAFQVGRMLHIQTLQGGHFYVNITSTTAATATVNVSPALPVGSVCMSGLGDGAIVAPLVRIEYLITNLGGDYDTSNDLTIQGTPTQLVRREVQFDAAATPVVNTERVVVEYPVDFNLRFIVDTALNSDPPVLAKLDDATASVRFADVNANPAARPQVARQVQISLSVRTPELDPRFKFVARTSTAEPLRTYRFSDDSTRSGAARVRTQTAEVFLPNVAFRGMR